MWVAGVVTPCTSERQASDHGALRLRAFYTCFGGVPCERGGASWPSADRQKNAKNCRSNVCVCLLLFVVASLGVPGTSIPKGGWPPYTYISVFFFSCCCCLLFVWLVCGWLLCVCVLCVVLLLLLLLSVCVLRLHAFYTEGFVEFTGAFLSSSCHLAPTLRSTYHASINYFPRLGPGK